MATAPDSRRRRVGAVRLRVHVPRRLRALVLLLAISVALGVATAALVAVVLLVLYGALAGL